MRNGLPVRLMCAQLGTSHAQHDNIVWAAGPWRSSGNWWEPPKPENGKTANRQNQAAAVTCPGTEDVRKLEHAWDREEWDVALAVTVRGDGKRERETQIGLHRLGLDRSEGRWFVEGSYD